MAGPDLRKAAVAYLIADVVTSHPDQRVCAGGGGGARRSARMLRDAQYSRCPSACPAAPQDVYATHLARDDSGAIAAFLDDGAVRTLQVRPLDLAACMPPLAQASPPPGPEGAHSMIAPAPQASVAKTQAGQLQVRLSNAPDRPPGCHAQLTLTKRLPGPLPSAQPLLSNLTVTSSSGQTLGGR